MAPRPSWKGYLDRLAPVLDCDVVSIWLSAMRLRLENSARCSGDGDMFLSTPSEQSRRAGPIGCALHTATSDLGRGCCGF